MSNDRTNDALRGHVEIVAQNRDTAASQSRETEISGVGVISIYRKTVIRTESRYIHDYS